MDFGTFLRMRMREQSRDMETDVNPSQSENSSHLPGRKDVYSDFDDPAHPQADHSRRFEDGYNFNENNAYSRDFSSDSGEWRRHDLSDRRKEEGLRPIRGRPSDIGRGQNFNSSAWADHVDANIPWQYERDGEWKGAGEEHIEQRESHDANIDWDELEREAELEGSMIRGDSQYPADNKNVAIPSGQEASSGISTKRRKRFPGISSDYHPSAGSGEKQPHKAHSKPDINAYERTHDHVGNKQSSQETSIQKREDVPVDTVSANRIESKTQDKPWDKDVTGIEDMAVTQLQDPNRTSFSCCYCGFSSDLIEDFTAHVKGDFHRKNFASLVDSKRRRQEKESLIKFDREELGKYSFLELDLRSFRKEPVVGLSCITEFHSIFGIRCICHLCGLMFSHLHGQDHVTSNNHRMKYLKEKKNDVYEVICQRPNRQSKIDRMYEFIQSAEQEDGRGTPMIHVYEDKSSNEENLSNSSDDFEVVQKRQQAFGEFVNQELEVVKQKLTEDTLPFDFGCGGGPTFPDQSKYAEQWDFEGEGQNLFDEEVTVQRNFSSDLGWEFPEEEGFGICADKDTGHELKDQTPRGGRGLENLNKDTRHNAANAGDSLSVNDGRMGNKRPDGIEMSKETEGEQKKDCQEESDKNNRPMEEADDKSSSADDKNYLSMKFSKDDLGKFSYLQKFLEDFTGETIIGLSFVTEYQHTTNIKCICHLCGSTFFYSRSKGHLISYKHRMRYLREVRPQEYASLIGLKMKSEIYRKLPAILSDIEKSHGRGIPKYCVYDDKKKAVNSQIESDNRKHAAGFGVSKDETDTGSDFQSFMLKEINKSKLRLREPVPFERCVKHNNQASDEHNGANPHLMNPQRLPHPEPHRLRPPFPIGLLPCPDPHFQGRPDLNLRDHDPHDMRMRTDPFEKSGRARPYHDTGPSPDELRRMRQNLPTLGPDPLRQIGRDRPYVVPESQKRRLDDPYIDLDPLKRMKLDQLQHDQDPLKRMVHRVSYLDQDHLKRIKFDEPYIDPDPLKRVLPSQKAAKKLIKPVVVDYGHGIEKKSATNKADKWEQDIIDILKDSKAPDSLAQLNCSYSSPKKEDTPKLLLPFSTSYWEKHNKVREKEKSKEQREKEKSKDQREKEKSKELRKEPREKEKSKELRKEPREKEKSKELREKEKSKEQRVNEKYKEWREELREKEKFEKLREKEKSKELREKERCKELWEKEKSKELRGKERCRGLREKFKELREKERCAELREQEKYKELMEKEEELREKERCKELMEKEKEMREKERCKELMEKEKSKEMREKERCKELMEKEKSKELSEKERLAELRKKEKYKELREKEEESREKERCKELREKEKYKELRGKEEERREKERLKELREKEKSKELREKERFRELREKEKSQELRKKEKYEEPREKEKSKELREKEKYEELREKKQHSTKKEGSQNSPDGKESRRRHWSGSPSRKYKRSLSSLTLKNRSRAMIKDSVRRDGTDSSSIRYNSRRSKRSKSRDDFIERRRPRSPVRDSREESDKSRDLHARKSESPKEVDLKKKFMNERIIMDLTSDGENNLFSRKEVLPAHTSIERPSLELEDISDTESDDDVDEAQADLIAEMLLTMKNSLLGPDADPQSALEAILSQDITKVLLASNDSRKKESPSTVKQAGQDGRGKYEQQKAGSSKSHFNLKSKVRQNLPARDKISFAVASKTSDQLPSQPVSNLFENDTDSGEDEK